MEPDTIERYDRQMRLWGQHGQSKFSNSKICLINAGTLGIEILKGLCLAGIGSFTILDSQKVGTEDVGCSFLPSSSFGQNRAEVVKKLILNLNEDVSGDFYPLETHLSHVTVEENDLNFWKQFNCVIASGYLYIDQIKRLSKICWELNIPMILCKSIGFYASMRSQFKQHLIIETHPDNELPSFYLCKPFRDLKEYFDSIDLDDEKISKYPYVVIIYKYLKQWQNQNGYPDERLPNSYAEKKQLQAIIEQGLKLVRKRQSQKNNEEEVVSVNQEMPFENYIEASKSVNSCFATSNELPKSVLEIFNGSFNRSSNHSKVITNTSRFWIIIKAIKDFVTTKNDGLLPVSGAIPDMTSSSEEYIRLQKIYAKKAREDVDSVFGIVQNYLNSSSCSPGSSLYEETKLVCKNIRDMQMVSTCPLYEEYNFKSSTLREEDEDDEFVTIDLCLKVLDIFFSTYGRLPGRLDDQVEPDISKLKDCIKQIVGKAANQLKTLDQCLYEVSRYGGAELHSTSAFIGGCVAQEVIKLITNQYVPVENTLVYNAMAAATKSFKFSDTFTKGSN